MSSVAIVSAGSDVRQLITRAASLPSFRVVKAPVRWSFYAFALSIPFEIPEGPVVITVPTLTAAVLVLVALLQPRICFRRPAPALWFFVAYMGVAFVSEVLGSRIELEDIGRSLFSRIQLILVFWIACNLMRYERIARKAILAFVGGCVVLAGLQVADIATAVDEYSRKPQRISAFGMNKNYNALFLSEGVLAVIGMAYGRRATTPGMRGLALPMVALLGIAILQTGSRGGLLAITAGLGAFLFSKHKMQFRWRNALLVLAVITFLIVGAYRSETMRSRIEDTMESGDMAGRQEIFAGLWEMFLEKPLLGWGMASNKYELAARLLDREHQRRDSHNMVLEVVTTAGLLGALPFFAGIWLCVRSAWRARAGSEGIVPFAMTAAVLMGNMSGNRVAAKLLWLVLAYAVASGLSVVSANRTRSSSLA